VGIDAGASSSGTPCTTVLLLLLLLLVESDGEGERDSHKIDNAVGNFAAGATPATTRLAPEGRWETEGVEEGGREGLMEGEIETEGGAE